jgi:Pyridoxamine 5'-phosphate oxidase
VTRTRDIWARLCLAAGPRLDSCWGERWRLRREMVEREPVTDLGAFSSDGAVAAEWATALADLQGAEVYWLSTVRPDGRPHVTPLLGVWLDGALYFCTGPAERKAKNLAQNPNCVLTTGCNGLDDGLDLVVEGAATKVSQGGRAPKRRRHLRVEVRSAFHGTRRHLVRSR